MSDSESAVPVGSGSRTLPSAGTVIRPPRESTRRRAGSAVVAAVASGLAAVLVLTGCAAGQDTQTDSILPSVNGALGQAGPIAIRNALIAYPSGGRFPSGGQAPLTLTIVNTGADADELVEVSSPVAGTAEVTGDRTLTPRRTLVVGTAGQHADTDATATTTTTTPTASPSPTQTPVPGSPTTTTPPTAPTATTTPASPRPSPPGTATGRPAELGTATVVLTGLTMVLMPGRTYPVTFVFRNAGSITLDLPIAAPTTPRPAATGATPHG